MPTALLFSPRPRRHPGSSRFPYTTLFRSRELLSRRSPNTIASDGQACAQAGVMSPSRTLDRKSTRLNSSHQIISYAVFCLKKKNNVAALAAYDGHLSTFAPMLHASGVLTA